MYRIARLPMRNNLQAASRIAAISRHMATPAQSSQPSTPEEPPVLFEEKLSMRRYILNRPKKLNSLNAAMLDLLGPKLKQWNDADLAGIIVGTGEGKAFCAGGDVAAVVESIENKKHDEALNFFQREFGMDYYLAKLDKPYVVVMDGYTMGGGFGLTAPAAFRVATEKTQFAMPETKIGYFPDVGGSYYLSRLDGQIGTYLSLTGNIVSGRAAFELGLATHFIHSSRVPQLLERLSALERPTFGQVASAIDDLYTEREPSDPPFPFAGGIRDALDDAFSQGTVEKILEKLRHYADGKSKNSSAEIVQWAKDTTTMLEDRSPTSLKVALQAIRRAKKMDLQHALAMELNIAQKFCSGTNPDFKTGVTAVMITKLKGRPEWSPASLADVSDATVEEYFTQETAPKLIMPRIEKESKGRDPRKYALPGEELIMKVVKGEHPASPDTAITVEELLDRFDELTNNKAGVREKVLEVVNRKCTMDGDKFLSWK
ncbi:3-hydroxyisobutyryl-coenzyme A hydrolase [Peniophora sp. CONT]|nr:3-hydroxyisobutyryl-coenzyme A hydrolase [Peniophora sp. CONT]